ncbi:MAG: cytochrome d ubiquinol oxidase subunit II [Solirubrobacteraceae bacterium]
MLLRTLPLVFVLAGLTLYVVLAGADFGAGLWLLLGGRGERGQRVREHAHDSMGPVWEANHVWLIFVLTVTWTAYPTFFGSVASTLAAAFFLAGLGIILRGTAYALRAGGSGHRELRAIDTVFAVASLITPFALGAAAGAIAAERVPVGNAAGALLASWTGATPLLIGGLAVVSSAYLAAVYLAADAARAGDQELCTAYRSRALVTGLVAGAVALAGLAVVHGDTPSLYHGLVRGGALAALVASVLAGVATLTLVWRGAYEPARYGAAVAVAAIIAGWALARYPTLLPGLTVDQAAASHDTLITLTVAVIAGAILLFPSLGLLFALALTGRFDAHAGDAAIGAAAPADAAARRERRRAAGPRPAVALLVFGVGLLNVASAPWAHGIGVASLLGFVVLAFLAIVPRVLADEGVEPQ